LKRTIVLVTASLAALYMQAVAARWIGVHCRRNVPTSSFVECLRTVTIWNEHDQEVGMSSLTHDLARLAAVTLSILFVVGTAFLASAQPLPMADQDICATPVSGVGAEASFLVENDAAMRKMVHDMAVKPTGDVDADFVAMMVPHHQGAIDMALAVLRHGRNSQIRRLAQEIIVTQQQEIVVMRLAVGQPLSPSRPSPLEEPSVQRIESKSSQPTDRAMEP
jgi:hypothetical protein